MPPLSHGRARADTMMTRVVARGVKKVSDNSFIGHRPGGGCAWTSGTSNRGRWGPLGLDEICCLRLDTY